MQFSLLDSTSDADMSGCRCSPMVWAVMMCSDPWGTLVQGGMNHEEVVGLHTSTSRTLVCEIPSPDQTCCPSGVSSVTECTIFSRNHLITLSNFLPYLPHIFLSAQETTEISRRTYNKSNEFGSFKVEVLNIWLIAVMIHSLMNGFEKLIKNHCKKKLKG